MLSTFRLVVFRMCMASCRHLVGFADGLLIKMPRISVLLSCVAWYQLIFHDGQMWLLCMDNSVSYLLCMLSCKTDLDCIGKIDDEIRKWKVSFVGTSQKTYVLIDLLLGKRTFHWEKKTKNCTLINRIFLVK